MHNSFASIEESAVPNKIYFERGRMYLTFDDDTNTKVVTVQLDSFEYKLNYYNHDQIGCAPAHALNPRVSSFLHMGKLFQFRICRKELFLRIRDIENDTLLNEMRAARTEPLAFRNTPLIKEGNRLTKSGERSLDEASNFFGKVLNSDFISISASSSGDDIEVTVGGSKKFESFAAVPLNSGALYFTAELRLTSGQRTTFFRSLFDGKSGIHTPGPLRTSGLEAVRNFLEENDKRKNVVLVPLRESFIIGSRKGTTYELTKFDK